MVQRWARRAGPSASVPTMGWRLWARYAGPYACVFLMHALAGSGKLRAGRSPVWMVGRWRNLSRVSCRWHWLRVWLRHCAVAVGAGPSPVSPGGSSASGLVSVVVAWCVFLERFGLTHHSKGPCAKSRARPLNSNVSPPGPCICLRHLPPVHSLPAALRIGSLRFRRRKLRWARYAGRHA